MKKITTLNLVFIIVNLIFILITIPFAYNLNIFNYIIYMIFATSIYININANIKKSKCNDEIFLKITPLSINYIFMFVNIIIMLLMMIIDDIKIQYIIYVLMFGVYLFINIILNASLNYIKQNESETNNSIRYYKKIIVKFEELIKSNSLDKKQKKMLEKVYEKMKYSTKMSIDETNSIDELIIKELKNLTFDLKYEEKILNIEKMIDKRESKIKEFKIK